MAFEFCHEHVEHQAERKGNFRQSDSVSIKIGMCANRNVDSLLNPIGRLIRAIYTPPSATCSL